MWQTYQWIQKWISVSSGWISLWQDAQGLPHWGVCVCVAGMSVATLNFIFLHHVTTCFGTSQWFSQGFPRIILLHVLDHFNWFQLGLCFMFWNTSKDFSRGVQHLWTKLWPRMGSRAWSTLCTKSPPCLKKWKHIFAFRQLVCHIWWKCVIHSGGPTRCRGARASPRATPKLEIDDAMTWCPNFDSKQKVWNCSHALPLPQLSWSFHFFFCVRALCRVPGANSSQASWSWTGGWRLRFAVGFLFGYFACWWGQDVH